MFVPLAHRMLICILMQPDINNHFHLNEEIYESTGGDY